MIDSTQVALVRDTKTGRLDPSFGQGGKVNQRAGLSPRAVAVQRDGKIVLAGSSLVPAGASSESRLTLVRLTSAGTLDNNGKAVAPPLGYWGQATAIALEPDGKIIVVGSVSVAKHGTQLGLMRYLPNGRLDTDFGTGGTVLTNFAVLGDPAVALQPDGKIVVGGSSDGDFALARYTSDGALDPSFGGGDTVTTPLGPAWLRTHSR